ncbi:MAG: Sec-independent protein translocase protein TatA [Paracoccaceae bacterium]|jgi:Sec-independent protein translocase protein TatA
MAISHVALIGMPSWLELVVIGAVLLVIVGPRLLSYLARRSVMRDRFR